MDPREVLRAGIEYVQACLNQLQEVSRAEGFTGFTDAQRTAADEGVAYITASKAEIERFDAIERAGQVAVTRDGPADYRPPTDVGQVDRNRDPFDLSDLRFTATRSELTARARTAIERCAELPDDQREHVTRLVERRGGELIGRVLGTGSELYRSASLKLMANRGHLLTDQERDAVARAQSLTDSEGGYAVPFTLDPTIILTNAGSTSPLRQISSVSTIVTDSWNGVTSAGATSTYKAEEAEATDDSITLTNPSVTPHRLDTFVPYSFEVGGDWVAFESDIREVIGDSKTNAENLAFTTGDGVDEPTGFVTGLVAAGGSSIVTPTTVETFAEADLYKMEESLGERFLGNAAWQGARAIYNLVRQLATSDGPDLWVRLGEGKPAELIGYPSYVNSNMDTGFDAAATANNYILAFGDWKVGFKIVDRVGANFELVPHLFGANRRPTGQRGIFMWCRNGSNVVVPGALRLLNIATTA